MRPIAVIILCAIAMLVATSRQTSALTQFSKAFEAKYVKESGDADFQAAYKKMRCNVCHVKGKKKDYVNAYGLALADLIPGNADERIDEAKEKGDEAEDAEQEAVMKEFREAIEKTEAIESPSGVTYGEMFKAHELPTAAGAVSIK